MSGINSGHHYLPPPQYRKKSTLSDIITIWYVDR
jgi:hypothetical protein